MIRKGNHLFFFLFFLLGILLGQNVAAVVVSSDRTPQLNLQYAIVDESKIDFSMVENGALDGYWQAAKDDTLKLGFDAKEVWLKIDLNNPQSSTIERLLYFNYPFLDMVNVWLVHDGKVIHHAASGDSFPFAQRPFKHPKFIFPIEIPDGKSKLIASVQTASSMNFQVSLWESNEFFQINQGRLLKDGMIYGMFVVMFIYNLFLWISVRSNSYLLYVAYVFFFGTTLATMDGYAYQYLWPSSAWLQSQGVVLFGIYSLVFVLAFSMSFLNIRVYSFKLYRCMRLLLFSSIIFIALCLFIPYRQAVFITMLLIILVSASSFLMSIVALYHGFKPARLYLLSWASLLGMTFVYALSVLNILPYSFFAQESLKIGSFLEVCLLSLALGDRINTEKREKLELSNRVSALKQTELEAKLKAQEEIQARNQFFASMTHELRTPLTAILGYSDSTLTKEMSKTDLEANTKIIERSGQHLLQLINNTLDISKIEAGKMELDPVEVNITELIQEIKQCFDVLVTTKGLYFRVVAQGRIPIKSRMDSMRLKQILMNLCSNAIKFTEQGGVTLRIVWQHESCQYQFIVEDTGIGLSPSQCENLFGAYGQADKSTARQFGGTGLGLNLSKKLAELMHGTIRVESELGEGSRFIVSISPENYDKSTFIEGEQLLIEANIPNEPGKWETIGDGPLRVLLAEDNLDNQKLIPVFLQKAGADEVMVAQNGVQALQLAQGQDFDLILMDIQMPEMDGVTATRILREANYCRRVYALTADDSNIAIDQALSAGCNGHLIKPIEYEKMLLLIQSMKIQKKNEYGDFRENKTMG